MAKEIRSTQSVYWMWPFENYKTFCPIWSAAIRKSRRSSLLTYKLAIAHSFWIYTEPGRAPKRADCFPNGVRTRTPMKGLLQDWVTQQAQTATRGSRRCPGCGKTHVRPAGDGQQSACAPANRGRLPKRRSPVFPHAQISGGYRKHDRDLKAGCIHVPLDPASPSLRTRRILESCENRWILQRGMSCLCSASCYMTLLTALAFPSDGWQHQKPSAASFPVEWSG